MIRIYGPDLASVLWGELCYKSEADQTAAASPQPLAGVELTEEMEEKC